MSGIIKYPVNNTLLQKYIRFFWTLNIEHAQLNHKIIPQRNINLRFNLSDTPHYISTTNKVQQLEDVYFQGLHDHNRNINLKIDGKVDVLGICFFPDSFYPFLNIPVSEFKNQLLGADEVGFSLATQLQERLKATSDVASRLAILENALVRLLQRQPSNLPGNFRQLFQSFRQSDGTTSLEEFSKQHNMGLRRLERMFNKYIGISANTYRTLNRFHDSANNILYRHYPKLSDVAYDNGYFDQMHFIKDFKRFTGNTPKNFLQRNKSLLQIGKLTSPR